MGEEVTSSPKVTRRSLLRLAGFSGLAGVAAACSTPWPRPADRLRVVPLPSPAPARVAPPVLHVVLASEGLPPLDETVRRAAVEAARQLGSSGDVQELAAFLTPPDGGA